VETEASLDALRAQCVTLEGKLALVASQLDARTAERDALVARQTESEAAGQAHAAEAVASRATLASERDRLLELLAVSEQQATETAEALGTTSRGRDELESLLAKVEKELAAQQKAAAEAEVHTKSIQAKAEADAQTQKKMGAELLERLEAERDTLVLRLKESQLQADAVKATLAAEVDGLRVERVRVSDELAAVEEVLSVVRVEKAEAEATLEAAVGKAAREYHTERAAAAELHGAHLAALTKERVELAAKLAALEKEAAETAAALAASEQSSKAYGSSANEALASRNALAAERDRLLEMIAAAERAAAEAEATLEAAVSKAAREYDAERAAAAELHGQMSAVTQRADAAEGLRVRLPG
jgi:hypothetical protein